jgi:hypothetical protein
LYLLLVLDVLGRRIYSFHSRHHNVVYDYIGVVKLNVIQGFFAIGGLANAEDLFQVFFQESPDFGIVFHHQYFLYTLFAVFVSGLSVKGLN